MDQLKRAAKGAAIILLASACNADAIGVPPSDHDPRAGKTLIFHDEFDDLQVVGGGDNTWTTRFHMGGANELASRSLTSNKELQVYVDPAFAGTAKGPMGLNPFSVSNGILTIRAEKASPEVSSHVWGYGYTSGLLTTADSFSQTYGYFEVRARVPRGKGLWPAAWLLPADRTWPPEIDILESLGQDPDLIHQTVHWTKHEKHVLKHSETRISGADTAFHTYGVDWSKTTIRWFIDGKETARAPTPPDLHKPVYLLLNLAVGGWAGEPAQDAVPGEFQIDYVRVYGSRPPRKRPAKATD